MSDRLLTRLVDPGALRRHLARELPGDDEPLEIRRHQAGHSCETFFLRRGAQRWVLRRPPLPPYLPTAHDVVREYRVLSALAQAPVRTPRPLLLCTDESVIGAPFYVMEHVDATVLRGQCPPEFGRPERHRVGMELADALAELHAVDHRAVGLEDFGKPAGYVGRQVARWTKQLAGATETTAAARELPDFWTAADWLRDHLPEASGPPTIVHGDYKLDNVAFAPDGPRLVAIFDWEMSTIGEPLADLGWMLSYWREPGDPPGPRSREAADVTRLDGFPSRAQILERYESRSGRCMVEMRFYVALAVWKLGIILEGSFARHLRGTTDDPTFPELERAVPEIGARALRVIREGV